MLDRLISFMNNWLKFRSHLLIYFLFIGSINGQPISFSSVTDGWSQTISNPNSQMILLGGLIGSGLASQYDQTFQSNVQSNGLMPNGLAKVGDYWGITGQLLLWGSFLNNDEKSNQLEYAMNAFIANGIITYGLKFAVRRERPDQSNTRSFPSGHTSNSFLTATIAQEIYGSNKGVPAYALACITGLSRIHDNKHYVSDVIFGAALGMAIGKGFAQVYQNNVSGKISIHHLANQSRIQLVWHF